MLALQAKKGKGSGNPFEPQQPPSTTQSTNEEQIPNVSSSSHHKTQPPRQALNKDTELPQTSVPIPNVADEAVYEEWDDRVERDATIDASLDAAQGSCNILKTQLTAIPNVPLPRGIGTGGSPMRQETMGVPLLKLGQYETTRIDGYLYKTVRQSSCFGDRLRQTKKVYGEAYTKLIMKVKQLDKTVKSTKARRKAKIVVSDDELASEDSSKHGRMIEEIDQDAEVTLVTPTKVSSQEDQPEDQLGVLSAAKVLTDAAKRQVHTYTRRRRAVSTGSGKNSTTSRLFSTAEESVSTDGASIPVSIASMVQEDIPSPVVIKDKAAARLQEELNEEERQRIARVHEAAQSFTKEEWKNIQATIEADEELALRIQAEEREKYFETEKSRLLVDL
ncbi:hypothetical protein Tco_1000719, partial [Tanacetum coccineum]